MRRASEVAIALAVGALLAARAAGEDKPKLPFTVSKETTAITSPLREDGTPDYVAALNEKYGKGVTPENNGFVVWLKVVGTGKDVIDPKDRAQVLKLCGAQETPPGTPVWVSYGDFLRSKGKKMIGPLRDGVTTNGQMQSPLLTAFPWRAADQPLAAEYLKAREEQLTRVAEVLERDKWWVPWVSSNRGWTRLWRLTGIEPMDEVMESFEARAMKRLGEANFDGFLSDFTTSELLARKAGFPGIGLFELGWTVGRGVFSEKQCRAVRQAMEAMPDKHPWAEELDIQCRWEILQYVVLVSQGNAKALPPSDPEDPYPLFALLKKVNPEQVDFDLVLKAVNRDMDEIVGAFREQDWGDGLSKLKAIQGRLAKDAMRLQQNHLDLRKKADETKEVYSQRVAESIMGALGKPMPKFGFDFVEAVKGERVLELQRDQVRVLAAVAEWKARTGEWPNDLGRLVPRYLKKIPLDPYSPGGAERMRYKGTVHGAQIYSVGPDGEDEGGMPSEDNHHQGDDFGVGVP